MKTENANQFFERVLFGCEIFVCLCVCVSTFFYTFLLNIHFGRTCFSLPINVYIVNNRATYSPFFTNDGWLFSNFKKFFFEVSPFFLLLLLVLLLFRFWVFELLFCFCASFAFRLRVAAFYIFFLFSSLMNNLN